MKYTHLLIIVGLVACTDEPSSEALEAAVARIQHDPNNHDPRSCDKPEYRSFFANREHGNTFSEAWLLHSSYGGVDIEALDRDLSSSKEHSIKISKDCLGCFSKMTRCAASNCKSKCADVRPLLFGDPRSPECRTCTHNYCGAEMVICSGLTPSQWPDFKR